MIMVFAGTSDAKRYVEQLLEEGEEVLVSTLTSYGGALYKKHPNLHLSHGRLSKEEKIALIRENNIEKIIDYTHPYATGITKTLQDLSSELGLSYERIDRQESDLSQFENVVLFESYDEIVAWLNERSGNILLTIGSHQLKAFQPIIDKSRLYIRVLPTQKAIAQCEELGVLTRQILAIQGPFSYEANALWIKELNIEYLVTKDSGVIGGTPEKIAAMQDAGKTTLIIERPNK